MVWQRVAIYFHRIERVVQPSIKFFEIIADLEDSLVTEQVIQALVAKQLLDSNDTNTFVFRIFPRFYLYHRWPEFFPQSSDWPDAWLIEDYERCFLNPPLKAGQKLADASANIPRMGNEWIIEAIERPWIAEF